MQVHVAQGQNVSVDISTVGILLHMFCYTTTFGFGLVADSQCRMNVEELWLFELSQWTCWFSDDAAVDESIFIVSG